MSLAENLLNSLDEIDYKSSRIAGSDVQEPHITVSETRVISVPAELKIIAVKGDKDVETVTIDCIRYWDNHDLSSFAIYINYILPNGDEATYIPEQIVKSDNTFSFNWVIGREITQYQGGLTFWIVAKLTDASGNLTKQWSSLQNSECSISQGGDKIYVPEKQTDQDVISQVLAISRTAAERSEQAVSNAKKHEQGAKTSADRATTQANRATSEADSAERSAERAFIAADKLENVILGKLTPNTTVSSVKPVPETSAPYAEVVEIGGRTRKCTNLIPATEGYTHTTAADGADNQETLFSNIYLNAGTYTISFDITAGGTNVRNTPVLKKADGMDTVYFNAAPNVCIEAGHYEITASVPSSGYYVFVWWDNGGTVSQTISKIMLNEGDTALPYEPYFEGLRSAPVTEVESVGANLIPFKDSNREVNGVTVNVDNGTITLNGVATGSGGRNNPLSDIFTLEAGTYVFSVKQPCVAHYCLSRANNDFLSDATNAGNVFTIDTPTAVYLGVNVMPGVKYSEKVEIILNKGTTAQPYRPYVRNTLPIPEAVRNIDGYGEGNPDNAEEYNAIICKDGKWKYSHKGDIDNNVWTPLATPEITDISNLLSDNLIGVEDGGTLTFKNEYGYDVPNTVNFYTYNNELMCADTFVGDLKGTANKAIYDSKGRDIAEKLDELANGSGGSGGEGSPGVGIESVEQTVTSNADGGTNEITVTLTDGSTSKFNVKNGSKGSPGNGISSVEQTVISSENGGNNEVTVTLNDGSTSQFNVKNGTQGPPGNDGLDGVGIESVEQTTASTVDGGTNVITVKLTNGKTYTFTVKNGSTGSGGSGEGGGGENTAAAEAAAARAEAAEAKALEYADSASTSSGEAKGYRDQAFSAQEIAESAAESTSQDATTTKEYRDQAKEHADQAGLSETEALLAAGAAETSASEAAKSASEASQAASDLSGAAERAEEAAQNAESHETQCYEYSVSCSADAETARSRAEAAEQFAGEAEGHRNEAKGYSDTAQISAGDAADEAYKAEQSASAAKTSETNAANSATDAASAASDLSGAAERAESAATAADGYMNSAYEYAGEATTAANNAATHLQTMRDMAEIWTFTFADGTVVTKKVCIVD